MRINKTDLAKKIQMLLPDKDRELSILSNVVLFDCTERSNVQFDLSSEIVLLMQGSEIVEAGNSQIQHDNNMYIAAVGPVDLHKMLSCDESITGLIIHVDQEMVSDLATYLKIDRKRIGVQYENALSGNVTLDILEIVTRLVNSLDSDIEKYYLSQIYVNELLFKLLVNNSAEALKMFLKYNETSDSMNDVIHLIHQDYACKFDVNELAKKFNMSKSSFYQAFKEATSFSPLQYIKHVKLYKAREMIINTGMNASNAAFNVGYESSSQFSREYKRMFGVSPGKERRDKMILVDVFDKTVNQYGNKTAFIDEFRSITYSELRNEAYCVAQSLISKKLNKKPVAIYMNKSISCIASFLGVAYSGNFYTVIDPGISKEKISSVLESFQPMCIITDEANKQGFMDDFPQFNDILCVYEDSMNEEVDTEVISKISRKAIDTDLLYVLYTYASVNSPKGVIISHRAVVDFIEWAGKQFGIDDTIIIGNYTPFSFSMSVFDVYTTLCNGGQMYIIPPCVKCDSTLTMKYLCDNKINTIFWVPTQLNKLSRFNFKGMPHSRFLKNIFFGGETMPIKELKKWREEYPKARFINFYGPSEVTDTCTIYEVNREFGETEMLPMGGACDNMDVFLLGENGQEVPAGEIGEVCVRGSGLSYGYYNDFEKTNEVFVQNPLNKVCHELIYKTGDLARFNEHGELEFVSRKRLCVARDGHRIELEKMENVIASFENVYGVCCVYDSKKLRLSLIYSGNVSKDELMQKLTESLPDYMIPDEVIEIETMPENINGKIDRGSICNLVLEKN